MGAPVSGAQGQPGLEQQTMEAPEAGARLQLAPRVARAGAGPGLDSEVRPGPEELQARDRGEEHLSGRSRAPPWPGGLMTEAPASGAEEEEEDPSQPCPGDRLVVSTRHIFLTSEIIRRVPTVTLKRSHESLCYSSDDCGSLGAERCEAVCDRSLLVTDDPNIVIISNT